MATLIYGAGGLGRMVRDILAQQAGMQAAGFLDSDPRRSSELIDGLPVFGGVDIAGQLLGLGANGAIVAIGDNDVRVEIATKLERLGFELHSAVHPLASLASSVSCAPHVQIGARATLCVHARIGAHTVISPGCIVDHDNVLEDGVFLEPAVRLAGGVHIEARARVGIGACVIPGTRIGRGATVQPGAVVIRDVPAGATVGGMPASMVDVTASRFVPDADATQAASAPGP